MENGLTILRNETYWLSLILHSCHRKRIYRHHQFFRRALRLVTSFSQFLGINKTLQADVDYALPTQCNATGLTTSQKSESEFSSSTKAVDSNSFVKTWSNLSLKEFLIRWSNSIRRVGECTLNELRLQRIDTLSLTLFIFGVCSRMAYVLNIVMKKFLRNDQDEPCATYSNKKKIPEIGSPYTNDSFQLILKVYFRTHLEKSGSFNMPKISKVKKVKSCQLNSKVISKKNSAYRLARRGNKLKNFDRNLCRSLGDAIDFLTKD